MYRKIHESHDVLSNKLNSVSVDAELSNIFSKDFSKGDISNLADTLFMKLKERFHFRAQSYSEIIEDLYAAQNINSELKQVLIDFFENVMVFAYRHHPLTHEEKDNMKKKLRLIFKKLEE